MSSERSLTGEAGLAPSLRVGRTWLRRGPEEVGFPHSPSAHESSSPMNYSSHILNLLKSYRHFCGHLEPGQAFFIGF